MHAYTKAMTSTTRTSPQTTPTSKDRTMNPHRRPLIRTLLTGTAYFLGLLLLTALWTVYGPSYDAQAAPLPTDATSSQAAPSEPCPAGEATGGTCGTEGQIAGPDATTPTAPTDNSTPPTTQRRCKGCRLSQEEYDARQADKQAAHDRAEARKQRGAERRAAAERKREERAARKASKTSPQKSSNSHGSSSRSNSHSGSESPSDASSAQDGTSTPADTSQATQGAPEASSDDVSRTDGSAPDSESSPAAPAPYTPLEIPEASRRPAPYDASKDPFEVRREAARQAADAVNSSASHSTSPDQVKAPAPTSTSSTGYWAEQMPTWALALIGFLAAAGIFTYKVSRPRSYGDRRS